MRFPYYAFATVFAMLSGPALWSCDKDDTQSSPSESLQAENQPPSSIMPAGGTAAMQQLHASCPMIVQGVDVAVSDTEDGITLTFTTDAVNLADLRARVKGMAHMYKLHRGHGATMRQKKGGEGMGHGMNMKHLAGKSPMAADALRQHLLLHQQPLHSGEWDAAGAVLSPGRTGVAVE